MRFIYLFAIIFFPIRLIYQRLRAYITPENKQKSLDIIIGVPMTFLFLCPVVFLVLALTNIAPHFLIHVLNFVIYHAILFLIEHLLSKIPVQRKQEKLDTTESVRRFISTEQRRFFAAEFLSHLFHFGHHLHHQYRTLPSYEQDLDNIRAFDSLVRSGEDVMIPKMRTKGGQKIWDRYIKAYVFERNCREQGRDLEQERHEAALLAAGGWVCACGRINPSYTYSCVCGKNKRDI